MTISVGYLEEKVYTARWDRQLLDDLLGPGIVSVGDLAVSSTGAARGTSTAAGVAFVQGTANVGQGIYRFYNDSAFGLTHDTAVTNPRWDRIIALVYDSAENAGIGADAGAIEIVKGTENAGAATGNAVGSELGIASMAAITNAYELARVLVPVGAGAVIPGGNVRDVRTLSIVRGGSSSSGLLAARPAANAVGANYRYNATDDWGGSEYVSTGGGNGLTGAAGTGWVLISSKNQMVLDVAASASLTFSGLDGNTDQLYELDWVADVASGASAAALCMRFNGVSTGTYWWYYQTSDNGGASAQSGTGSDTSMHFALGNIAERDVGRALIHAKTGARRLVRSWGEEYESTASLTRLYQGACSWSDTAANITSITIFPLNGTVTGRFVLRRSVVPA